MSLSGYQNKLLDVKKKSFKGHWVPLITPGFTHWPYLYSVTPLFSGLNDFSWGKVQKEGAWKRTCPLIKRDRAQAGTSLQSSQEPAWHIMTPPIEDPIRNAWIFLRYSLNGPSVSQKEGQGGVVGPKVDSSRWTISTLEEPRLSTHYCWAAFTYPCDSLWNIEPSVGNTRVQNCWLGLGWTWWKVARNSHVSTWPRI